MGSRGSESGIQTLSHRRDPGSHGIREEDQGARKKRAGEPERRTGEPERRGGRQKWAARVRSARAKNRCGEPKCITEKMESSRIRGESHIFIKESQRGESGNQKAEPERRGGETE